MASPSPIAVAVRREMRSAHLSQTALATELGISQQAVSDRLRGHTPFTVEQLLTVASLLGVSIAALTDEAAGSHEQHGPPRMDALAAPRRPVVEAIPA